MSMNGSTLLPTDPSVHQPVIDDREPPVRRKMFFYDRIKILVLMAHLHRLLQTSHQKTDIPLMTWGEALRDQLRAKWWVLILAGLEVIRQIHNIISEHSRPWQPVLAEEGVRWLGAADEPDEAVHPVGAWRGW